MSNDFTDNEKIQRLEQRLLYLESRVSMLESNALGYPIPYLENNMATTPGSNNQIVFTKTK